MVATIKNTNEMDTNRDMKSDDELLAQFFGASKPEIEDQGFSDRVMRSIPRRAVRRNQLWTTVCFAAAMAVFLLFDGIDELRVLASNIAGNIAGYLTSFAFNGHLLIHLILAVVVLFTVAIYNILSNQR